MLTCECGKTFETYRQLNGHKSTHTRGEQYASKRAQLRKPRETYKCLWCGKDNEVTTKKVNLFCNNKCQAEHQFVETLKKFEQGLLTTARTIYRCLVYLRGNKCDLCGNEGKHNGKELKLQVDHTDGNAGNNSPTNVRLLCPNCHSQTETFVARNKGKGRQARGLNR